MNELKVGDTLWVWDSNHRVYNRDENNRPSGPPIWREHYVKKEIVGETSRSWEIRWDKISKKDLREGRLWPNVCVTDEEIDKAEWLEVHRRAIIAHIEWKVKDYGTIRAIAELIGYEPKENRQ